MSAFVSEEFLDNLLVCFVFLNTSLVHFMLEEVVNSTVNRCLSPELMEPSVSIKSSSSVSSMSLRHIVVNCCNFICAAVKFSSPPLNSIVFL